MTGAYLPVSTTAENYGPFPRLDYRYEQGVTAVIGVNGSGKSFLVNAPAVALFGHTPDGVSFSELLSNTGADRMVVCHEFEVGGERYRVRRSWSAKGGGKATLDLEHNWTGDGEEPWTPQTKASMRETQEWITGLVGMTRETFLASALQIQNEASFASRATSRTERCDLLMTGLRLGEYERLKGLAERDRKEAERQAGVLEVKLAAAEHELAGLAGVKRDDRIARNEFLNAQVSLGKHTQLLDALLEEQRRSERRASERRAAEAELREAETARLRLREQAAAADIARDSIAEARETLATLATVEDLESADRALRAAQDEWGKREYDRQQIEWKISSLDEAECPTCERPFDNYEDVLKHEASLKRELAELPPLPEPSDLERKRIVQETRERDRLEERIAAWQQAIDTVEAPGFTQAALKADIAVSDARKAVAALPSIGDDPFMPKTSIALARQQVDEQRQRLDEARQEKARLEAQLERLQRVEEQVEDDRLSIQLLGHAAALYARMEEMYGRDGIPALVIESVAVPYLERTASEILHRLGKPWTVEIHLGKETKKGDVRPALDVKVLTETGAVQRYEQCSGGEQMRLDIALHVAFVRLWKQRNGSWSELYALDEPEGLDADGMAALVDVLDFLAEEFTVVQLVSHHSELRDSIGQVAMVSRNGRGSVVGAAA